MPASAYDPVATSSRPKSSNPLARGAARNQAVSSSWFTLEEKHKILADMRACLAAVPALQRKPVISRATGPKLVYKTRDDARAPEPRETARSTEVTHRAWGQLVDDRIAHERERLCKGIGEFAAQYVAERVDPLKRELELTRRELDVVRMELNIKALQEEVRAARAKIPNLAAVEARFDAENKRLKAKQADLERELAKTTERVSKMRVDQALADSSIRELRKQAEANSTASVELEVETRSTHFAMRATHPAAARALKDFASQIIRGHDGKLLISGPAGRA
jgi:hypothetical protein